MPSPLSVTVTRMPPKASASGTASVTTWSLVAPARRAFWISSTKASASVALKKRVTRSMAPSWTRARMVVGNWERSVMALISRAVVKGEAPRRQLPAGRQVPGRGQGQLERSRYERRRKAGTSRGSPPVSWPLPGTARADGSASGDASLSSSSSRPTVLMMTLGPPPASLDQEGECGGKLARAERVVGGDGVGVGHGRAPGEWMSRPKRLWTIRPSPGPSPAFALAGSGQTGRLDGPGVGDGKAVSRPGGARRKKAAQARQSARLRPVLPQARASKLSWEIGGTAGVYPDNGHIHPVIGCNRGDLPEGSNGEPWDERIDIPPE